MTIATHYNGIPIPKEHQDLERVLATGLDRVILYGPPGTGKTYSAVTVATGGRPSFRLVCTEDMSVADVSGMFMPNGSGTFTWLDGVATKAWRTGGRLVIDEIDKASGDVFAMLLAYTDSVGSASISLLNGEIITPAPGFSAVMTTNLTNPDHLPEALRDRFPVALPITKAHPAALDGLHTELRPIAMELIGDENNNRYVSLRAFYAFQQLINGGFTLMEAGVKTFTESITNTIVDSLRLALVPGGSQVLYNDSKSARAEEIRQAQGIVVSATAANESMVSGYEDSFKSSVVEDDIDFSKFEV